MPILFNCCQQQRLLSKKRKKKRKKEKKELYRDKTNIADIDEISKPNKAPPITAIAYMNQVSELPLGSGEGEAYGDKVDISNGIH